MTTIQEARAARAAAGGQLRASDGRCVDRPRERRASEFATSRRGAIRLDLSEAVQREVTAPDGTAAIAVGGMASVYDAPYQMYDFFGPYVEVARPGMVTQSLAADPMVEYTLNHGAGGAMPMAHTRNGTLDLTEDESAFNWLAMVDPTRTDVSDMLKALKRGDLAEASFKFRITAGVWSPDYEQFDLLEVDVDGGDVSTVNFGANPAATSGLRSAPTLGERARMSALLSLALAE